MNFETPYHKIYNLNLTVFSPRCWATSKTRRTSRPSTSKAFKMAGSSIHLVSIRDKIIRWVFVIKSLGAKIRNQMIYNSNLHRTAHRRRHQWRKLLFLLISPWQRQRQPGCELYRKGSGLAVPKQKQQLKFQVNLLNILEIERKKQKYFYQTCNRAHTRCQRSKSGRKHSANKMLNIATVVNSGT